MPLRSVPVAEYPSANVLFNGPPHEPYLNRHKLIGFQLNQASYISVNNEPFSLGRGLPEAQLTPRETAALVLISLGAGHDHTGQQLEEWFGPPQYHLEEWYGQKIDPIAAMHQKLGVKRRADEQLIGRSDEIAITNAFSAGVLVGRRLPAGIFKAEPASVSVFLNMGIWLGTRLEGQELLQELGSVSFGSMHAAVRDILSHADMSPVDNQRALAVTLSRLAHDCLSGVVSV